MKEDKNFFIVDKSVLPEIFLKVMDVKNLLESKKEKTVQDAVNRVGISRSAFYKYRDAVHPLYENTRGKTVTISLNMDNTPGLLSAVLNSIATEGANILTINQTIPINGIANVTVTIETNEMRGELGQLMGHIEELRGIHSLKIIGRE
ncbi:MAG: ACT domain-containing protein [Anaerotignum sp.]|nr:ACT domain-containing protein [Anaerotignum sp.]